jgi:hypothetical protein
VLYITAYMRSSSPHSWRRIPRRHTHSISTAHKQAGVRPSELVRLEAHRRRSGHPALANSDERARRVRGATSSGALSMRNEHCVQNRIGRLAVLVGLAVVVKAKAWHEQSVTFIQHTAAAGLALLAL